MAWRARRTIAPLVAAMALFAAGCGGGEDEPAEVAATTSSPTADSPFRVVAAADIGIEAPGLATLTEMGRSDADLGLALGDLSYAGPGSEAEFCDVVDSLVGEETPFELLAGNHEEDTGEDGRIANLAECLPDRMDAVGEYGVQYYFDVGELARFVMISPDLTIEGQHYYYGPDDDGGDTPQLAWLKDAISGARDAGIPWVVVGMHKPCITVGEYYCDVYQDLFTTLIEERVDLVLSGHDHSYQRSKQIATGPGCSEVTVDEFDPACVVDGGNALREGRGPVFVITGAGGAELYDIDPDDPEAGYFASTMGRNTPGNRSGMVELEITADRLDARFVGSTPGGFTDRFRISR